MTMPFELDITTDAIIWNTPGEYAKLDIKNYILQKHKLDSSRVQRVEHELYEFEKRNLTDLLRFLVYLVDTARKNNIVYGVGRGSSVSSYVLFLLGVH
jgi:DNA polymerase III alpha subunit